MQQNQRNKWLDIAKGITIVLMVIGHTSIPDAISRFIWAFHMPLFFIASGWATNWYKYSFTQFAIRKIRFILTPFVIYSAIVLLLMEFIDNFSFKNWLSNGWGGYALWFIPVLFFASLLDWLVFKISNLWVRYLMIFILLLSGCFLCGRHIQLSWSLSAVPYACFLISVGTLTRHFHTVIDKPKSWILIASVIVTFLISQYCRLDMAGNSILPIIPITIGALSGTLMVFTISSYIVKISNVLSSILQTVGRETYIIVAFSQIFIMLINQYFNIGVIVKYVLLIVVLVLACFTKNIISKLFYRKFTFVSH